MTLTELLMAVDEAIREGRIVERPHSVITLEGKPLTQELLRGCILEGRGNTLKIIPPTTAPPAAPSSPARS